MSGTDDTLTKLPEIAGDAVAASDVFVQPWWTPSNAMTMCVAVLVFGVVVIILMTRAVAKGNSIEALMKLFGMTLVIIAAIFLVVAGYTETQIAPVIGLLGTIVGYILGNKTSSAKTPSDASGAMKVSSIEQKDDTNG